MKLSKLAVIPLVVALSPQVQADEIRLSSLGQGATSAWEDDSALAATGTAGWVFAERFAVQLIGSTGYAGKNRRVVSGLGAGAQWFLRTGRVRPYLRGALVRVVEQPFENFADDPLGAVLGMSDEAYDRFGLVTGAGIEVGLVRTRKLELFFSLDLSATLFDEDKGGPKHYTALGFGLGIGFDIGQPLPYRPR